MIIENQQKKLCTALVLENIDECFTWGRGEGIGTTLSVRDCIDLTSRKLRDPELCDLFVSRANNIMFICGDTGDCENQWITGASDHAQDCRYAVEQAMKNE